MAGPADYLVNGEFADDLVHLVKLVQVQLLDGVSNQLETAYDQIFEAHAAEQNKTAKAILQGRLEALKVVFDSLAELKKDIEK